MEPGPPKRHASTIARQLYVQTQKDDPSQRADPFQASRPGAPGESSRGHTAPKRATAARKLTAPRAASCVPTMGALERMRTALLAGAGSKCPTELANVAHHALETGQREAVRREFEKLASPPEALGRALQEAALHPDQTAPSAVARAADAAGQSRSQDLFTRKVQAPHFRHFLAHG